MVVTGVTPGGTITEMETPDNWGYPERVTSHVTDTYALPLIAYGPPQEGHKLDGRVWDNILGKDPPPLVKSWTTSCRDGSLCSTHWERICT